MKLEIDLRIRRLEAILQYAISQNPISLTVVKQIKAELTECRKLEYKAKHAQG